MPARAYVAANRYQQDDFKPYLLEDDRLRQDVDAHRRRHSRRRVHAQRSARIPRGAGCSTPAPRPASTSRSTTARTGSRCSSTCRASSVRDLAVHGNDLIAATHGRAFWVIDDISLLRQLADSVTKRDGVLLPAVAGDPLGERRRREPHGGPESARRRGDRLLAQGRADVRTVDARVSRRRGEGRSVRIHERARCRPIPSRPRPIHSRARRARRCATALAYEPADSRGGSACGHEPLRVEPPLPGRRSGSRTRSSTKARSTARSRRRAITRCG